VKRIVLAVLLLAVLAWLFARPLDTRALASHPRPARSYAAALALAEAMRADDGPAIATECRSELLTHGARTAHVVLLLHGLTNCPAQFDSLARIAYARGANVLVPRLPRHGLADRMTEALGGSDARELCAWTDRAVDAARGLGDTLTVAGLSVGGTLAAWAAAERPDVDRAVLIAPMLGVAKAPGAWRVPSVHLLELLPNQFVWWDDVRRQRLLGPKHVYPRFATRAVVATLTIGARVLDDARRTAPGARAVALVSVGGDRAVDNALNVAVLRAWRARGVRDAGTYAFPESLHLNHDIVDPEQVGGNPAITYPVLARAIGP